MIENLARRCKDILIGGAMAYTFLSAKGINVGSSRVEKDKRSIARELLELCEQQGVKIHLPVDHVVASDFTEEAEYKTTEGTEIEDGWMALDIGPKTRELYASIISQSKCVFWNGPMGVFEWEHFADGTKAIGESLSKCDGYTLVGGGDSAAATKQLGFAEAISHISTGGGASLAFLEERTLPGLIYIDLEE
jgi:phosphoglycerate kinase